MGKHLNKERSWDYLEDKMKEEKAIGQLKLQLNGVLEPFKAYGLDIFIPEAIKQIVILSLQLHDRLNGKDVPIDYNSVRGKKF